MSRKNRRRLFALLCAALLCVPGFPAGGNTGAEGQAIEYWVDCDNCDVGGIPVYREGEAETRDGLPGVWLVPCCPECGQPFPNLPMTWEPRTAAQPEEPGTQPEDPGTQPEEPGTQPEQPVIVPEAPVTVPEEPVTVPEAPVTVPEAPVIVPEQPVTIPEEPVPVPEEPAPVSAEAAPAAEGPAVPLPESAQEGVWRNPAGRDTVRFPVFSAAYPSRRLRMEGDPEAEAPVPGVRIWPEPGTSSPLRQVVGGDGSQ